ncbi:MAG TPA: cbb3-type cytochrome c oxidase subunit II [Puia sp.]|nr:cbb3-type cytochrome c oxidase subunit II [Puia sp.]
MEWFDNHKTLFTTAFLFFGGLTLLVAVFPALNNQRINKPLPGWYGLSPEAQRGKQLFIANGCVACHTQQVRDVEMDKQWGSRPSIAADYAVDKRTDFWRNTATLMGTERTGPDLTDIGNRQPSIDWQLVHLYNPRIVVKESIMPAYPWLFTVKLHPDTSDKIVNVPAAFRDGGDGKIAATDDALCLVAYLRSLKQIKLPDGTASPDFLYKREAATAAAGAGQQGGGSAEPDGKQLFTTNCQSCHQANGEGLPGAFPPLKGSPVVNGDDLQKYVDIIMHGYDARAEYGVMPPVGMNAGFTEHEVTAIMNYERSSWGNNARKVTPEEIKAILSVVNLQSAK